MLAEVKEIVSLDTCEDGLSLAVTFLDAECTRHTMIFRIDNAATASGDGVSVYKSALIESLVAADWLNPITCVSASGTVVRKTPVSWEKAADILLNLRPLVVNFVSDKKWVFKEMEEVVSSALRAASTPGNASH